MCSQQGVGEGGGGDGGVVESGSHLSRSSNLESWSKLQSFNWRLARVLDLSFVVLTAHSSLPRRLWALYTRRVGLMGGVKLRAGRRQREHQPQAYDRRDLLICESRYTPSQAPVGPSLVTCDDGQHPCRLSNVLIYTPSHSVLKNLYLHFSPAANLQILLLFPFFFL